MIISRFLRSSALSFASPEDRVFFALKNKPNTQISANISRRDALSTRRNSRGVSTGAMR